MDISALKAQCERSRRAAAALCDPVLRTEALKRIADGIEKNSGYILSENGKDIKNVVGLSDAMKDRLLLTEERIAAVASSVRDLAALGDPLAGSETKILENGLKIVKTRVPLGVIAMIYEARPNVTADAAALAVKSGNAVILRGGKEAINSNVAIAEVIRGALCAAGCDREAVFAVPDTDRATVDAMMSMRGYIDLIIPRGGKGLISFVTENSNVPVIETGAGNCHVYLHRDADLKKAIDITVNAKTQRPSVCNAAETLLCDRCAAEKLLLPVAKELIARGVVLRCCEESKKLIPEAEAATEDDFYREYNDLIMAVKLVDGVDEAVEHINKYGTKHSEAIVTENREAAERFQSGVDAAAVYVNASTRFTDGGVYGLGAEIGISTQKLHVRGPFADEALTTTKYRIYGDGQVR